jgi:predicted nucleic acid-binding protein
MPRKYVLDTNCFIGASRDEAAAAALAEFSARAAPFLYLSSVVAAVVTPSRASWEILGSTLSELVWNEGLELRRMLRSFMLDVLIAHSCRENGVVLISSNTRDFQRISRIFVFEWTLPFPALS